MCNTFKGTYAGTTTGKGTYVGTTTGAKSAKNGAEEYPQSTPEAIAQ